MPDAQLSRVRTPVENAIAGMNSFNILVHDFRNHRPQMDDDVIAICVGLWNFLLSNSIREQLY